MQSRVILLLLCGDAGSEPNAGDVPSCSIADEVIIPDKAIHDERSFAAIAQQISTWLWH